MMKMVKIIYKTNTGNTMFWSCNESMLEKYLDQCELKGFEVLDWEYV